MLSNQDPNNNYCARQAGQMVLDEYAYQQLEVILTDRDESLRY
jgi:hypothetical protein